MKVNSMHMNGCSGRGWEQAKISNKVDRVGDLVVSKERRVTAQ